MSRREELVKKAVYALHCWGAGECETDVDVAELILDASLPQVSTVAELEALPYEALLVDMDGGAPARWTVRTDAADLMRHGPLTVVWPPDEVTA